MFFSIQVWGFTGLPEAIKPLWAVPPLQRLPHPTPTSDSFLWVTREDK